VTTRRYQKGRAGASAKKKIRYRLETEKLDREGGRAGEEKNEGKRRGAREVSLRRERATLYCIILVVYMYYEDIAPLWRGKIPSLANSPACSPAKHRHDIRGGKKEGVCRGKRVVRPQSPLLHFLHLFFSNCFSI
jgi:hypothetical protein